MVQSIAFHDFHLQSMGSSTNFVVLDLLNLLASFKGVLLKRYK